MRRHIPRRPAVCLVEPREAILFDVCRQAAMPCNGESVVSIHKSRRGGFPNYDIIHQRFNSRIVSRSSNTLHKVQKIEVARGGRIVAIAPRTVEVLNGCYVRNIQRKVYMREQLSRPGC